MKKTVTVYTIAVALMAAAYCSLWFLAESHDPFMVMMSSFGSLFIALAILGMISGAMPTKSGLARREERPFKYWSHLIAYLIAGPCLIVIGFTKPW